MARMVVRYVDESGTVRIGGSDALEPAVSAPWSWIDVTEPDAPTLDLLSGPLSLHPLATEDALHGQRRPKLDLYPEGPFMAWLTPRTAASGGLDFEELDFFLCGASLLTLHPGPVEAVDEVAEEAEQLLPRGTDWVLHAIIDRLVDSMLPIADSLGDRLEEVEDRMLDTPTKADLAELYAIRRRLLAMHRVVSPERDMLLSLSRQEEHVSAEVYRYFSDVVDHVLRVQESLETLRDIGAGVMDIYLSAQSNRLNEIMKVLTVVTVVLGAVTAISGIYGMNLLVGMWPSPDAPWSFAVVIVIMAAVALSMSLYFRRKNWW